MPKNDIELEQMKSILLDMLKTEFDGHCESRALLNQRTEEQVDWLEAEYDTYLDKEDMVRFIECHISFPLEEGIPLDLCPTCGKDMELMCNCDDDVDSIDDYYICTECHDPDCEGC